MIEIIINKKGFQIGSLDNQVKKYFKKVLHPLHLDPYVLLLHRM